MAEQLVAQWQELLPGKDFKKLVPSLVQDVSNFVDSVDKGVCRCSVAHIPRSLCFPVLSQPVPGS